jgi:hypothetical protein
MSIHFCVSNVMLGSLCRCPLGAPTFSTADAELVLSQQLARLDSLNGERIRLIGRAAKPDVWLGG